MIIKILCYAIYVTLIYSISSDEKLIFKIHIYKILCRKQHTLRLFSKSRFRNSVQTRSAVDNSLSDATEIIWKLKYFCASVFKFGYKTSLRQKNRASASDDILENHKYLSSFSLRESVLKRERSSSISDPFIIFSQTLYTHIL